MSRHEGDHPMCGVCWITTVSARLPRTEGFDGGGILRCCFCGRPTSSGTWRRTENPPPFCPDSA